MRGAFDYNEILHPRDRLGRFRDTPDAPKPAAEQKATHSAEQAATVSVHRMPRAVAEKLRLRVDELAKRSRKLGIPPVEMDAVPDGSLKVMSGDHEIELPAVRVTLRGEPPMLPGYRFVGVIDHDVAGEDKIVARTPFARAEDDAVLASMRRESHERCDHCGRKSHRSKTFVLVDGAGKDHVVGSTCLKDFTGGHGNPHALAASLEAWQALVDDADSWEKDEDSYRGARSDYQPVADYLAAAVRAVRTWGWASKKNPRDDGGTTAEDALSVLWGQGKRGVPDITPEDEAEAAEIVAWLPTWDARDDFAMTLKAATAGDSFRTRQAPFVAAAVPAFNRERERRLARAEKAEVAVSAPLEPLGAPEAKITVRAVLARVNYADTQYGQKAIYVFQTADGRYAKWFTNPDDSKWKKGQLYDIAATVKGESQFRGERQTDVIRVKALADLGPAPDGFVGSVGAPTPGGASDAEREAVWVWLHGSAPNAFPGDMDWVGGSSAAFGHQMKLKRRFVENGVEMGEFAPLGGNPSDVRTMPMSEVRRLATPTPVGASGVSGDALEPGGKYEPEKWEPLALTKGYESRLGSDASSAMRVSMETRFGIPYNAEWPVRVRRVTSDGLVEIVSLIPVPNDASSRDTVIGWVPKVALRKPKRQYRYVKGDGYWGHWEPVPDGEVREADWEAAFEDAVVGCRLVAVENARAARAEHAGRVGG